MPRAWCGNLHGALDGHIALDRLNSRLAGGRPLPNQNLRYLPDGEANRRRLVYRRGSLLDSSLVRPNGLRMELRKPANEEIPKATKTCESLYCGL